MHNISSLYIALKSVRVTMFSGNGFHRWMAVSKKSGRC